jgi:predicted metal-dependent hydrolase
VDDDETLWRAVRLYNSGDYLACQELLEEIDRGCTEERKPLVRALAMLSCAMHLHFHRGGGRGALNLMRQCLILLDDLRPEAAGIATGELYEGLIAYLEDLQERRTPGPIFFDRWLAPKIRSA